MELASIQNLKMIGDSKRFFVKPIKSTIPAQIVYI